MSTTDAVMLGRAIAAARSALGMKRGELAARAGVSYPYLSELENGTKRGSTQKVAQIAEALGLTGSQLLARAEALTADPLAAATGAPPPGPGQHAVEPARSAVRAPGTGSGADGVRAMRFLGSWRTGSEQEEELVERIAAIVRREIDAWLDSELEPLIRRRVQEALPPPE